MNSEREFKSATYGTPQVPDYNTHRIGDLLSDVIDHGERTSTEVSKSQTFGRKVKQKGSRRLFPTNSERMNRALKELGTSAFKIHMLLWQWRGAPAKGNLPYFTVHGLSKFCRLTRPTVRAGIRELVRKGWIQKSGYNKHHKNELYRLIPIRDVSE